MSFKEKLSKYAQLIVKAGLNVQPAQIVVIDAPVESVELVRLVTKEAYAAGARVVVVKYNDEVVSRYKYKYLEKVFADGLIGVDSYNRALSPKNIL